MRQDLRPGYRQLYFADVGGRQVDRNQVDSNMCILHDLRRDRRQHYHELLNPLRQKPSSVAVFHSAHKLKRL